MIKSQLWPKSSGSYFVLFLLLKAPSSKNIVNVPCHDMQKTLHNLISPYMSSFFSYRFPPLWGRDPAVPGSSLLFFKNSSSFLPWMLCTCSCCLENCLWAAACLNSGATSLERNTQTILSKGATSSTLCSLSVSFMRTLVTVLLAYFGWIVGFFFFPLFS